LIYDVSLGAGIVIMITNIVYWVFPYVHKYSFKSRKDNVLRPKIALHLNDFSIYINCMILTEKSF